MVSLRMSQVKKSFGLGIDLGSSSIGWAVLNLDPGGQPNGVLAMGVRRFEAGVAGDIENGRDESKAIKRRLKRGPRRQHWRRQWRMKNLFVQLCVAGLLPPTSDHSHDSRHQMILELDGTLRAEFPVKTHADEHLLPYRIRALALKQKVSKFAFGRALYSLAQRRGFLSNRKANSNDDELGVVKAGIAELDEEMTESDAVTLGQYFAKLDPEQTALRRRWTARRMFLKEFEMIWESQARFYPELESFKKKIQQAIFYQRPLKSAKNLIGRCELARIKTKIDGETAYIRPRNAPKGCLEFQEFRILQRVNDLQYVAPDGEVCSLTPEQRKQLTEVLNEQAEITFNGVRKLFGFKKSKEYDRNYVFNFEAGGDSKMIGNRTAAKLAKILGPKWFSIGKEKQTDLVNEILAAESEERLQQRMLAGFALSSADAAAISRVALEEGYASLSRRAIRRLMPLLNDGMQYANAVQAAFPFRYETVDAMDKLPPVQTTLDSINNPAVIRSLTELRKIVNALLRQYGCKPTWIRIELARELKHSRENRQRAQKRNKENEKTRASAASDIANHDGFNERFATRDNILKIRLAKECDWCCPYSGKSISMAALVGDEPQFEIEHTVPFSRSLDNSYNNKMLCHVAWNRRKN